MNAADCLTRAAHSLATGTPSHHAASLASANQVSGFCCGVLLACRPAALTSASRSSVLESWLCLATHQPPLALDGPGGGAPGAGTAQEAWEEAAARSGALSAAAQGSAALAVAAAVNQWGGADQEGLDAVLGRVFGHCRAGAGSHRWVQRYRGRHAQRDAGPWDLPLVRGPGVTSLATWSFSHRELATNKARHDLGMVGMCSCGHCDRSLLGCIWDPGTNVSASRVSEPGVPLRRGRTQTQTSFFLSRGLLGRSVCSEAGGRWSFGSFFETVKTRSMTVIAVCGAASEVFSLEVFGPSGLCGDLREADVLKGCSALPGT